MRWCLMVEGQEGVTWPQWLDLTETLERVGAEGIFTSDHYGEGTRDPRGSADAWTMLSAVAARTDTLRLGTMVSPVTFRLPGVLTKVVTTVDHVSNGRVELGLGAGWWEGEHRAHGIPFPETSERFEMLEEQLEIVHRLWSEDDFAFDGRHYVLEHAHLNPKPVQQPHPPIVIGGKGGPRIARLVGRWGDEFNRVGGTPDEIREAFDRVREAVVAAGRDASSVTMSFMTWFTVGRTEAEWRERARRVHAQDPDAGPFETYLEDVSRDCIVGTVDRAVDTLGSYRDAGVERFILNDELFDDLEHVELLAREIISQLG
jgi:F420-dependent oxidoreductase-like protein